MAAPNLRLLSLDGGGVRGLASLFVLKQLLSHVPSPTPVKPCDFFDMICGTSTGGLIAIMLGRLGMSVDECILAFTSLMDRVFVPSRNRLPVELHSGKIRARYPADRLTAAIQDVILAAGFDRDAPFRGPKKNPCKTLVVALADEGRVPVRITDYERRNESQGAFYAGVTIWEAARATSAATSFFPPVDVTVAGITRRFHDGALGANNPVNELWMEAGREWPAAGLEGQVRSLLSVGTGRSVQKVFGEGIRDVMGGIAAIATETDVTAEQFAGMHLGFATGRGKRYWRFNPPDLSDVGLDGVAMKGVISQRCERYGEEEETRERMGEWAEVSGGEMRTVEIRKTTKKTRPGKLFYSLGKGAQNLAPDAKSPWQYLTLQSYREYEKIYDACKRADLNVWSRVLPPRQQGRPTASVVTKPLTMAVIYMLHAETALEGVKMSVDADRREMLKRFTKWVPCRCKEGCKRKWNFVNEVGLHKNGEKKACEAVKATAGKGWFGIGGGGRLKRLEAMQDEWYAAV
ncbi:hypothetical protein CAC42_5986 [Sphaceloma murrayae]|uniref:PNPLA domain-containing protein n=1 Tax=Sphaceloma murrayae TaxID=2082308 RepID=A0A2K1QZS8_9PEZI|nr:hypothetical protein CAC42_5986 [Sphaceloma murrayae]